MFPSSARRACAPQRGTRRWSSRARASTGFPATGSSVSSACRCRTPSAPSTPIRRQGSPASQPLCELACGLEHGLRRGRRVAQPHPPGVGLAARGPRREGTPSSRQSSRKPQHATLVEAIAHVEEEECPALGRRQAQLHGDASSPDVAIGSAGSLEPGRACCERASAATVGRPSAPHRRCGSRP